MTDDEGTALETITHAVNPVTGELVDLRAASGAKLAEALDVVRDYFYDLGEYKAELVAEVARRADARNARKVELDGVTFEVNAPTIDEYNIGELHAALAPFIEDGTLDESVLDKLVRYPMPKRPPPEVNKRELKKLWTHENRALLAALAGVRRRVTAKRTAKVIARPIEATATEETTT